MDKHGTFMKYNIVILKYKNISWINYTPQIKSLLPQWLLSTILYLSKTYFEKAIKASAGE